MASTKRPPPKNVASKLLTPKENDTVFSMVGHRSISVATAVAQIYFAESNNWCKKHCGVACFVKDNEKRSYFIRVYDLQNERLLWEQELYNQFKYDTPENFFHMFASDNCWAGLNFASEVEANGFKQVINDKIQRRQQRRQEKRRPAPQTPGGPPPAPHNVAQPPTHVNGYPGTSTSKRRASTSSKEEKKKDKGGKKKLTKADISLPSDFKHVSHVGWDPEKGFNVDEMDPQVKGWFNTIGVSDDQLKDQNTAQFIRNFIDQHGGLDALKEDAERLTTRDTVPPPPPPSRGGAPPPPPPSRSTGPPLPSRPPAPPPPSGGSRGPPPPAPPQTRGLPPAPVSSRGLPPPPPPQSNYGHPPPAPPPSRHGGSMPPPPPPPAVPAPPMNGGGMAPPPPPPPPPTIAPAMGGGGGGDADERGGLLSQIHQGISLKKVDPADNPRPAPTGRGALLDQIRQGKNLKKVTQAEKEESPVSTPTSGLGAALFQALQNRATAIQDDGDDSDSEEFDDDEWDEDN
ncbi:actin nucleation-promoting factor WASL-like [Diadema setosum]|uniref:actin nucleation-promoting factor WASL-like n=1 Tax=Diadema setosum TaxID=31175 RepID=UPI003B3BD96E